MGQRTRNDDALLGGRFSHKSGVLRLIKKKRVRILYEIKLMMAWLCYCVIAIYIANVIVKIMMMMVIT